MRVNWAAALAARRLRTLWPVSWCFSVVGIWCRGARAEATAAIIVRMLAIIVDCGDGLQVQWYC